MSLSATSIFGARNLLRDILWNKKPAQETAARYLESTYSSGF